MNLKAELNNATPQLFGTAYRQGNRLHFATGMAFRDYVALVHLDQAPKGSTLDELRERTNRPKEAAHGKAIATYLSETACAGLPFIFPSFILNYGLHWQETQPRATLVIFAATGESLVWPAIFKPPASGGLPVTDGGHRTDELMLKLKGASPGRLAENALSVIFVFEEDEDAYHQDFADCAKAKAMAKSQIASWDRRDIGRRFGIDLVEMNVHLRKQIDATSNSVNLSNNAARAWSMSALHSSISGFYAKEQKRPDGLHDPARVSDYIDAVFTHIPMLASITAGASPASFRNTDPDRGGCVLLRGVGLAVLMQGYIHAVNTKMAFDTMARKLGELDWYVLRPDAIAQGKQEDAYTYINHAAYPMWKNMIAMMAGDRKFRLKGTRDAAEVSFAAVCSQFGI
jgi:hypothetical protein